MTTIGFEDVVCGLCDASSRHRYLMSTNAFGPSDLDFRPPPMRRSTMDMWLQECPSCGLVANKLAEPPPGAAEAVRSPEYQAISAESDRRGLVRRFLRHAFLEEHAGNIEAAAHASLHAAWCADDRRLRKLAAAARLRSAELYRRLLGSGAVEDGERASGLKLRLIDILRRCKHWDEAVALCEELAGVEQEPMALRAVRFQRERALARDAACYDFDEVEAAAPA